MGKPIVTCTNCKHVVCAEYIDEESIEISHRQVWFQFFFDRNLLQRNEIILIVLSKINYSQILIFLQLFLEIKEKQKRRAT